MRVPRVFTPGPVRLRSLHQLTNQPMNEEQITKLLDSLLVIAADLERIAAALERIDDRERIESDYPQR